MSLLDKYKLAQDQSLKIESQKGQPYKAFEVSGTIQRRFDLRPGHYAQHVVSYAYLFDIVHAGGVIIGLSLSMPSMTIAIEGENLQDLVDGLREEKIAAIQEYVPAWHTKPEPGVPVITKMEFIGGDLVPAEEPAPQH